LVAPTTNTAPTAELRPPPATVTSMYIFNQSVSLEFYQEFVELVGNSSLYGKAGAITLFTDGLTSDLYAAFTPLDSHTARPVGHASTPSDLFIQVLNSIEPHPMPAPAPDSLEHPGPGRWWWLCFADVTKPEGQQFLGVAIVEGATLRDALERVSALRIYAGGKVAPVACTLYVPAPRWRNRLLNRPEVIAARRDLVSAGEEGLVRSAG
jgi:hypothetical protein